MNKLEGFYALEKFKIRHPKWKIVRLDIAEPIIKQLNDSAVYTLRTAVMTTKKNQKDFWLPRKVGLTGARIKEKFAEFKATFQDEEDNVYVIIYPYFKAIFSGTASVIFESNPINSSKTAIIEACNGSLWNLTEHGNVDYKARIVLSNINEVISEKSDIPRWQELRGEIIALIKQISENVKIKQKTEFRVEWSFTDESFMFYELKTI